MEAARLEIDIWTSCQSYISKFALRAKAKLRIVLACSSVGWPASQPFPSFSIHPRQDAGKLVSVYNIHTWTINLSQEKKNVYRTLRNDYRTSINYGLHTCFCQESSLQNWSRLFNLFTNSSRLRAGPSSNIARKGPMPVVIGVTAPEISEGQYRTLLIPGPTRRTLWRTKDSSVIAHR